MKERINRRRLISAAGASCVSLFLTGCATSGTGAGLYVTDLRGAPRWIDDTTGTPAWSRDGTLLAWGDEHGLRTWSAERGDISRVAAIPMVGRPAWSPDGTAVAILDAQSRLLQRVEIATGITVPLATIGDGNDFAIRTPMVIRGGPAWSPGGDRIAFVCWDGFGDELCVVDQDGNSREELTSLGAIEERSGGAARSSVTSAAWSPDGSALAVAVQAEQQGATSGVFRVELSARSGERRTRLTPNAPVVWDVTDDSIVFSARVEGRSDVYRLPADGREPALLTFALADGAREPSLNDVGGLAVVSGQRIAVLQPQSADATFFVVHGLASAAPAWTSDGQRLAFLALPTPIDKYP